MNPMGIGDRIFKEGRFLRFDFAGYLPSKKSPIWNVHHIETGGLVGVAFWSGDWRQYVFEPVTESFWSAMSLREITRFLNYVNEDIRRNGQPMGLYGPYPTREGDAS